ncbi:hypothetical protein GCM10010211_28100 [Streptomyces albospinus]|uniref:Uncharacterized protein n=1 Tax=Streptomyces albospinus TaxID=285515 RepID=A0ABQ2V1D6_9ACTN|nr:hypothetical protein [Streptomyces albospinus]GGU61481.1 hypothetical protein GCM10010211_28100 [Streptomyces albospinus]
MTTNGGKTPAERRPAELYTGGERPFDAEDLVRASGREPTPESLEWAKRLIEEKGAAAIERYLP